MQLNKEEFLKTELGGSLDECIKSWDAAIIGRKENRPGTVSGDSVSELDYEYFNHTCDLCQAQWEVFQLAIKQFYGIEYHFSRTDEYFGLVTEDETDWLMKVERQL